MRASLCVLAAVLAIAAALPTAVDENKGTIQGRVVEGRNVSHVFANIPVVLYNMDENGEKKDEVDRTTTDSSGAYMFANLDRRSNFSVCAETDRGEICMRSHGTLPSVSGARNRRTLLSSLNVPVPAYLSSNEFEIQTIWTMDNPLAQCDWDSVLQVPYVDTWSSYGGNCICGWKDYNSMGFCCLESTSCYTSSEISHDSNCANDAWGFEVQSTDDVGPGTNVYKHMVYGYGTGSTFDTVSALSQGQINLWVRGSLGLPYLQRTILLTNAAFDKVNTRFWHTLTVTWVNGAYSSNSVVNHVTCDPSLTTGSTATLTLENGSRTCHN